MNKRIVNTIVKKCLGYKRGEVFLIVCDDKQRRLADDFHNTARSLKIETVLVAMTERKMHGQEPPKTVAGALKGADLALLLTTMSLSHTMARKNASSEFGTRIASLPGVTEDILKRSVLLDYSLLHKKVSRLTRMLTKGKRAEIHTEKGTRLVMSIRGRKGFSDDGLYTKKGAFGNLPAGESCIAPREGTANGRLIVDGSAPFLGKIRRPIEIIIKNGYAQNIPLPKMTSLVKYFGKSVLNVAELGIGLNPKAKVTGIVLEDEKAKKTAHIAFGNNKSFGGNVYCSSHLDFVFTEPRIFIDGVEVKLWKGLLKKS